MALTLHGTVSDNTVALDRKTATPLIINGDMQIAQRSTSETGITSTGYHTLDRFNLIMASGGTFTMSQSTDVPTGQGFASSLKFDCTTANSSLSAGSEMILVQRIEGQNLQMLNKGTSDSEVVTMSFWVKSAKTGTYVFEMDDLVNSRDIHKTYTINSANTWEKKVFTIDADTTGTLANTNANALNLNFFLLAGSTFTSGTLNTTWASSSNANRAVGQVNLADSTSNDWYITGVQLEIGSFDANSIPPFQFEDRGTSLARCQRYFQTIPGAKEGGANPDGTAVNRVYWDFKVSMRATPTITQGSGAAAAGVQFTNTEGYGIYRDGGNTPNIGSNAKADAEL